jgi:hypothetical protein
MPSHDFLLRPVSHRYVADGALRLADLKVAICWPSGVAEGHPTSGGSGKDHVGLVADDSPLLPELVTWTQQRLDGDAAPTTCTS